MRFPVVLFDLDGTVVDSGGIILASMRHATRTVLGLEFSNEPSPWFDDIQAAKAELESQGVTFYSDVNVVDDGVLAGWRWVYFADPDGYPLELVENAYERPGGHAAGIHRYLHSRPQQAEE